jgi:hypothetical protein
MADESKLACLADESETERHAALLASLLSERLDVRLDVIGRPFQRGKDIRVRILFDDVVVAEAEDSLPDERD